MPHAASLEEALAAVDVALALPDPPPPAAFAFDAYSRKAQGVLNRAVKAARALSRAARDDLQAALGRPSFAEAARALAGWVVKYRTRLASLLSAAQLAALLEGAREVAAKLPPVTRGEADAPPPVPPTEGPPAFDYGPGDAGRPVLPLIEEAARSLQAKVPLPRAVFDRLDAASRAKAFTVAGVSAREALEKVRDLLAENVLAGADLGAFREKVLDEVGPGTFLSDAHLETVFRGAVQGGYSDGQYGLWQHPVVKAGFPYAGYDAIHDDRVRDNHLALETLGLDGTNVYRVDDPVFQTFRPPWDYQDRCGWTLLSVEDAAARGVKEAKRWLASGEEPSPPARVPWPPFRPPEGFRRFTEDVPLSIRLSADPLGDYRDDDRAVALLAPAVTAVGEPGPNQGPGVQPAEPEGKPHRAGRQRTRARGKGRGRKLARRLRARGYWREYGGAAFGMVGDEWHGPKPPGEGWVAIAPGPRGGKRWRRAPGAPPLQRRGPRASPAAQRPDVGLTVQDIRADMAAGRVGEFAAQYAERLSKMTVQQIHELKRSLGLKASGKKLELVQKIINRARQESKRKLTEGLPYPVEFAGNIGDAFAEKMLGVLSALPPKAQAAVAARGARVQLAYLVSAARPDLKGVTPPGWSGATWDAADGFYDPLTREVVVTEFVEPLGAGRGVEASGRSDRVLRHEFGHGFDHALGLAPGGAGSPSGQFSQSQAFLDAYRKDAAGITDPAAKRRWAYLLQGGDRGPEEAFAECFAALAGGGCHPAGDLLKAFPETGKVVLGLIQ